jgi:hypothetical protein
MTSPRHPALATALGLGGEPVASAGVNHFTVANESRHGPTESHARVECRVAANCQPAVGCHLAGLDWASRLVGQAARGSPGILPVQCSLCSTLAVLGCRARCTLLSGKTRVRYRTHYAWVFVKFWLSQPSSERVAAVVTEMQQAATDSKREPTIEHRCLAPRTMQSRLSHWCDPRQ